MAARVLLLVSFTGLFATAWNSDCPEPASTAFVSVPGRGADRPSVVKETRQSPVVSVVGRTVSLSSEFELSQVVLPEAIAAGTYRVVDALGRVGWMSISADQSPNSNGDAESFYASQSADGRWYFIRVETAPLIAWPPAGTAVRR